MDFDFQEAAKAAVVAGSTGFVAWLGLALRKAIANWGKSKHEIAQEALEKALKKVAEAKGTPDVKDDEQASQLAELAERHLNRAREIKSVTDALGE